MRRPGGGAGLPVTSAALDAGVDDAGADDAGADDAAAFADAGGGDVSAADAEVDHAAQSNPTVTISCFMLRDSTRMGTILRYVLNSCTASRHPVCTQPHGSLHLGNARTAFFSYLWARKTGGRFILRIEDTDVERSELRFRDELMAEMGWLGLEWDEGPDIGGPSAPYSQAERGDLYRGLLAQLERNAQAYPCYCTAEDLELSRKLQRMAGKPPRYAGTCRHLTSAQRAEREARGLRPTLRFAVPGDRVIEFVDTVHGPQRFASDDIGGFHHPQGRRYFVVLFFAMPSTTR